MNLMERLPADFFKLFTSKYTEYYIRFLAAIYEEMSLSYSVLGPYRTGMQKCDERKDCNGVSVLGGREHGRGRCVPKSWKYGVCLPETF